MPDPPLPPPPGLPPPPPPTDPQQAQASAAAWQPPPGYASHEAYAQAYAAYYGSQYSAQPAAGAVPAAPGVPNTTGGASAPAQGATAPPAGSAAAGTYDYSQYYASYPPNYNYNNYYQQYPGHAHPPTGNPSARSAAPATAGAPWQTSATAPVPPQTQQPAGPGGAANYRAVPPPTSIPISKRPGIHLRPQNPLHQHQYQRPSASGPTIGGSNNTLVSAAQAAAAAISAGQAPSRPAYISVASGPKAAAAAPHAALNPQNWPPAVKAYVERAFKAAPFRQRTKLQDVLRMLIGDAQEKGELLTRGWDILPLPDLSMSAQDAAGVILEVCAISRSLGAPSSTTTGTTWWQQQQKQQNPYQQQYHQAQQGSDGRGAIGMVSRDRDSTDYSSRKGISSRKRDRWASDSDSDRDNRDRGGDGDDDVSQGGPFSAEEEARRRRRAGRFKDGTADGVKSKGQGKKGGSAAARRARLSALLDDAGGGGDDINWDAFAIKGTCQNLEKSYFRLTSAPDPSTVRPEPVLRRALSRLVRLISSGEVNYFYAQDQFKGLRQDCVVQALHGPLALAVYEAHARAALEYGDVAEYNQCQGQMATLWAEGVKSEGGCEAEFLACRLLYQTVHARHGEQLGLLHTLRKVGPREATVPEVAHALQVRSAVAAEDYSLFFRLYTTAPKLGRALMDLAVPRQRFAALNAFVKAFKPSVPVDFLARLLGFVAVEDAEQNAGKEKESGLTMPLPGCVNLAFEGSYAAKDLATGRQECTEWLEECGAVITGSAEDAAVDCKASTGQLRMPEEKEKVAHGDANLDIGDFLKSFEPT